MPIAVVSDTHSRGAATNEALRIIHDRGISTVLHCGDIEDAALIELFAGLDAHFVFGNCDSDRAAIRQAVHAAHLHLHEPFGDVELAGKKLAFLHGDDHRLLHDLIHSGHFDYIFHGHTHKRADYRIDHTRIINPGALHRANPKSFLLLDVESGAAESVVVS